jgi:adenine-specific DNA glycosylase
MFCCRRFTKTINDNFSNVNSELIYLKSELEDLKSNFEELQKKQQQTKKNLVKIIDTFTLKEYVLFKTRLLTKKQTESLLEELYTLYDIKDSEKDIQNFDDILNKKPSILSFIRQIDFLKNILTQLREPSLKDSDYADIKKLWCSQYEYDDNGEFLNNVILSVKKILK